MTDQQPTSGAHHYTCKKPDCYFCKKEKEMNIVINMPVELTLPSLDRWQRMRLKQKALSAL
jgi:hypothetical protein